LTWQAITQREKGTEGKEGYIYIYERERERKRERETRPPETLAHTAGQDHFRSLMGIANYSHGSYFTRKMHYVFWFL
jgi:hypothetical protein